MHPPIPVAVLFSIALAASSVYAATDPHSLQPSAPRTVAVTEAETPPQVRAGLLQSTLIGTRSGKPMVDGFGGRRDKLLGHFGGVGRRVEAGQLVDGAISQAG
jgi:type IV secretion system protein VirB9